MADVSILVKSKCETFLPETKQNDQTAREQSFNPLVNIIISICQHKQIIPILPGRKIQRFH